MEWRNGIRVGAESCDEAQMIRPVTESDLKALMDGSDWFPLADDLWISMESLACTALSIGRALLHQGHVQEGFCCSLATNSAVAERFSDF